jgi:hypothetical protein
VGPKPGRDFIRERTSGATYGNDFSAGSVTYFNIEEPCDGPFGVKLPDVEPLKCYSAP